MLAQKAALQNHTAHITKMKKNVEAAATKRELAELGAKTGKMALNSELQELYHKVVPPVAVMEEVGRRMQDDVAKLTSVVCEYDRNLCTKANKQELFGVDNKFRQYVKKAKYKPFVEETELDLHELKTETNTLNTAVEEIRKNLLGDIHAAVRKATSHLKATPVGEVDKNEVDSLMVQALEEERNPGLRVKHDPNAAIKKNLMDVLAAKASTEDLQALGKEKTNKADMDLQMKCIDILQK